MHRRRSVLLVRRRGARGARGWLVLVVAREECRGGREEGESGNGLGAFRVPNCPSNQAGVGGPPSVDNTVGQGLCPAARSFPSRSARSSLRPGSRQITLTGQLCPGSEEDA
jgi:hypothetical protein